jgi:hypothetical protein
MASPVLRPPAGKRKGNAIRMTTQEPKTPSLRSALARGEALKRTPGNEAELVASARSGCSPA